MRTARVPLVAVPLLVLAMLGTACATNGPGPDPSATTTGAGELGLPPEPTDPPTDLGPTDISPTYPDDVEAYAKETLDAWAGDDASWLGALTSAATYDDVIDLLASVNDEWDFHRCDGTAGSSYCSFINDNGDVFSLRISHALLGQAHAAIDALLDETVYPDDGVAYVKEFVAAWQFGNEVRMLRLSTPEVVDDAGSHAPVNPTYATPQCCGGGLLQVKANWAGTFARFDVGTTLLGGPHAIVGYDAELGFGG
jgi:hypothetical protein